MSGLVVKVRRIDALIPHPNADSLELALVGGWQTVVKKDIFKNGDLVVFVPPDTVIPQELSDKLGVTKYLHKQRLIVAKLRGENSFGLLIVPEPHMWEGQDVAEYYGITKYIPPVKMSAGDAVAEAPVFFKYTDIENMRNYNNVLKEGEPVIYTEKIHGCFTPETNVMLANGEFIQIQNVSVGDFVLSYNEATSEFEPQPVEAILDNGNCGNWIELKFDNGKIIICTLNHLFLTKRGYVKAKDLQENDEFIAIL